MELSCEANSKVSELMRCIRSQASGLISGLPDKELAAMELGLAHSLSRYKLKFSPDKIDTMIVQAVSLLDDLDKELNNYIMRCREWYGWHFPELGKIITDNLAFVRTVELMGTRDNAKTIDLSDVLPEEVEEKVKEAAEISMGTEISGEDIINIKHLCQQVVEIQEYRRPPWLAEWTPWERRPTLTLESNTALRWSLASDSSKVERLPRSPPLPSRAPSSTSTSPRARCSSTRRLPTSH